MLNKVPKFGAITIMGSVVGLFFDFRSLFPLAFMPNILCAVLADTIQYKASGKEVSRQLLVIPYLALV